MVSGMLFGLLAFAAPASASQADLDAEVQGIINDYRAKAQSIQQIVARIKWSGITDPRLFDAMEAELLARYATDKSREGAEHLGWLVQALAFSGSSKYQPTIEAVGQTALTAKLMRHGVSSLRVLPQYAAWNPIITKGTETVAALEIPRQRVINMLNSNDPELMRAGASFVLTRFITDRQITDSMRDMLAARYKEAETNDLLAEAMAWFCKVLGTSGQKDYIATLQDVKANSDQSAIERWSDNALDMLQEEKD